MSGPIISFDERAARGKLREPAGTIIRETVGAVLGKEAAHRAEHYERGFIRAPSRLPLVADDHASCAASAWIVGGKAAGMVETVAEALPVAKHQRSTVHFYRNALAKVRKSADKDVSEASATPRIPSMYPCGCDP